VVSDIGEQLRAEVARRAEYRCGYCLIHEDDAGFSLFSCAVTLAPHTALEHGANFETATNLADVGRSGPRPYRYTQSHPKGHDPNLAVIETFNLALRRLISRRQQLTKFTAADARFLNSITDRPVPRQTVEVPA
jgi:hypothetical protein